jgi:carbonic anhydrase
MPASQLIHGTDPMKMSRKLASCSFAFAALALCATASSAAPGAAPHWDYRGPHGTAHWGEMDAAYESCARGQAQSPIDIRNAQAAPLAPLEFSYGRVAPSIVNNGHTIQVNVPKGQSLRVGDHVYELVQFHFHTPSEERVNGKPSAMVAHFVHKDAEGKLAVVAALIQPGPGRTGFDTVLAHLPQHAGEALTVEGLDLDLAGLLPAGRRYWEFEGSLTTPPCSEGVRWMVLTQPVLVSADAIRNLRRLYPANARPVQPLNGRVVRLSQ